MSGQWWENDLIVGPFADISAANAWAAASPSSLFPGLLATAGGVQIRWVGGGVGWRINPDVAGWDEWALVGDSITASNSGWNGGTHLEENGGRYNPNFSIPSLASMLSGGRLNIARNFGFGGRNTAYILSQIGIITGGRWKNYIVQVGTNDATAENLDLTSATIAYNQLLDALLATDPKNLVCIAIPSRTTVRTQKWNYICRNACADRGIEFIDPWLSVNDQTTGFLAAVNTVDGTHPIVAGKSLCAAPLLLSQMQKYLGSYPARIPLYTMNGPYDPTTSMVQNGYFTQPWSSGIPEQYASTGSVDAVTVSNATQPAIFSGRVLRLVSSNISEPVSLWTNKVFVTSGNEYEISMYMDLILSKNLIYNMRVDYFDSSDVVIQADYIHQWDLQSALQADTTELKGIYRGRMLPPQNATYCKLYWNFLTAGADYSTTQPLDFSLAALEIHPVV